MALSTVTSIQFTDSDIIIGSGLTGISWYYVPEAADPVRILDFQVNGVYLEGGSAMTLLNGGNGSGSYISGMWIFKNINANGVSHTLMNLSSNIYLYEDSTAVFEDINNNANPWLLGGFAMNAASPHFLITVNRVMGITRTIDSYNGIVTSRTAGTSPFTFTYPYKTIFVITTIGGMSSLTLDGQALFNGVFALGQIIYVGAMHPLIATWTATAPIFEVLTIE